MFGNLAFTRIRNDSSELARFILNNLASTIPRIRNTRATIIGYTPFSHNSWGQVPSSGTGRPHLTKEPQLARQRPRSESNAGEATGLNEEGQQARQLTELQNKRGDNPPP